MKERPILFSAPMVRAILAGQKNQTRRILKNTGLYAIEPHHGAETAARERAALATQCPYGQPGDRLWVRETHMLGLDPDIQVGAVAYKADGYVRGGLGDFELQQWRPSIHMPRWASRILLEITGVRVERLKDISEDDAIAEGCCALTLQNPPTYESARTVYSILWDQINGSGSWSANPWVWVIEFKKIGTEQ